MEANKNEKWVFIINPVAGNGFGKSMVNKVREMVALHGIEADLILTERKGHATELAKEYAGKGYRYIVGVGGDGTLNEIARSLVNNEEVVVGIIPAGTGNDFIQILGFPDRFNDADWHNFFTRNTIHMDVGECNGKIFLNGMGLGFDAEVAAKNYDKDGNPKKGNKNKYIWHIIKTLLLFREKKVTIGTNGSTTHSNCFINTVAIGRRFAGGFYLTPEAIANDGLLDVCMIRKLNLVQRFRILPKVPKGTHIFNRKIHYYQTCNLSMKFPMEVPFHVDGELFYSSDFNISIMPEGIRVIYNPAGKHFFRVAGQLN